MKVGTFNMVHPPKVRIMKIHPFLEKGIEFKSLVSAPLLFHSYRLLAGAPISSMFIKYLYFLKKT